MAEGPPRYRRTAVVEQVGVVRANRAAEQSWAGVQAMAQQVGQTAYEEHRAQVLEESVQAGMTAGITRDNEGRLTFTPVEATDEAARAYNKGGKAAYLAAFGNDARTKAASLATQHANDPESFKAAWEGYMKGTEETVPQGFRTEASIFLDQQGSQHYVNLIDKKTAQDRVLQQKTITTQITSQDNDLLSLARAGKMTTPEYRQAQELRASLVQSAVEARFITPEIATEMNRGLQGEVTAQAYVGDVMAGYRKRGGGPDAARWALGEADKIVGDDTLVKGLSPGQRERFRNLLQAEVREAETTRQIGWSELSRRFELMNDDIAFGVVPKGLTALKSEAKALGHTEMVGRIERVEQVGQAAAAFGKLPLTEQATKVASMRERWLAGDLNPTERAVYAMYDQTHQRAVREVQADPVRYAMRSQGDVPAAQRIVPLQFDNLEALPGQLATRAAQMRLAQGRIGIAMPLLSKEEAQVIASEVKAPDDPTAAESAARRFEMVRTVLSAAATPEQIAATRKAMTEVGMKEGDMLAADPDMVQHLGISMARRLFGAFATKETELPADVKKKLDSDIAERWRSQYEFNNKQAAISGDGTVQRRQDLSYNLYKKAAYALGDPKQAYEAVFGASFLLDADDAAIRLPKTLQADLPLLTQGLDLAKAKFVADAQPENEANRRKLEATLRDAKWANDREGNVGLYLGGTRLASFAPAVLVEMGRAARAAEDERRAAAATKDPLREAMTRKRGPAGVPVQ